MEEGCRQFCKEDTHQHFNSTLQARPLSPEVKKSPPYSFSKHSAGCPRDRKGVMHHVGLVKLPSLDIHRKATQHIIHKVPKRRRQQKILHVPFRDGVGRDG